MPPSDPPQTRPSGSSPGPARKTSDASAWNWVLLVPIVIPLLTPLFNHDSPRLFSFPLFYWLQLAFVLLGVGCTTLVYRKTKRRS